MNQYLNTDKGLHFLTGGLLFGAIYLLTRDRRMALVAVAIAGVLKEVARDQMMGLGTPDWMDAIATVNGGVFGALVVQ